MIPLIMSIALLFEWIRESYWFIVKKKPDNHNATFVLRAMIIFICALACLVIKPERDWQFIESLINYIMLGTAIHFTLFMYLLNLTRRYIGKQTHIKLFHLNLNSKVDKWLYDWAPYTVAFLILLFTLWQIKPPKPLCRKLGIVIYQIFVLSFSISINLNHWLV